MLQAVVITLREGVEAALIVGIFLGFLKKTGRQSWNRIVYWGMSGAVAASLIAAYVVHRLELAEETYQGWLMLAGGVFVLSMVIWMWRTGKRLKQDIEIKLSSLAARPTRPATVALFLFVFLMVLREGIETVLFLAAVSLRSSDLLNFTGGVVGLGLAVSLGVAFFKGSLKVDLRKFFAVTSLVLGVVALQLFIAGIHELSEAQILPSSQREMALVGPIVNKDAFFFVVIVALCLFLVIAQRIQAQKPGEPEFGNLPASGRRKLLAEQQRDRFWKMAASGVGLLIMVLISAQFIYSQVAHAMSPAERVALAQGVVRIPVAPLADRKLHRYVVSAGGTDVRLIAILDTTDSVRAALDACLICGNQGYYQDGKQVICRNCAAAIYVPTIGMAGGCNPIHVDYLVEGDALIVPEAALLREAAYFK